MTNILLSIVVPIYNVRFYLEKCIDSIVNQSYKNIEIILVDDGSTDGSSEICDKYSKLDSRIKVIHKENGGLVNARKAGALMATGEYILPIDGDDWVEKDYCMIHAKVIQEKHPDIVWDLNLYKDYENRIEKIIAPDLSKEEWYDLVTGKHGYDNSAEPYSLCKKCYRKNLYCIAQQSVDDSIEYGEDVACVFRMLSLTNNIIFLYYAGYHYVQRSTSILHSKSCRSDNAFQILVNDTCAFLEQYGKYHICSLKQLIMIQSARGMLLYNFRELQKEEYEYLVPFKQVIKGSRVVVFGAGLIGQRIVSYLKSSQKYVLVRWIDTNANMCMDREDVVFSVDNIRNDEYDYILVATTKKIYQNQMIQTLINMNIPMTKIVSIDDENLVNSLYDEQKRYK